MSSCCHGRLGGKPPALLASESQGRGRALHGTLPAPAGSPKAAMPLHPTSVVRPAFASKLGG